MFPETLIRAPTEQTKVRDLIFVNVDPEFGDFFNFFVIKIPTVKKRINKQLKQTIVKIPKALIR